MTGNVVYLKVSHDKYELPLVVADSVREMAEICGVPENNISSLISKYEHGILKWTSFRKVVIPEDME